MSKLANLSIIPVIVLAILICVFAIFEPFTGYNFSPSNLLLACNLIFITGTNIAVALISAKSYLDQGLSNVLVLGCAVLVSGLAALFAGWASGFSANANVTIFNIGIFIASVLQVFSATLTLARGGLKGSGKNKVFLASSYPAVAVIVILIAGVTLNGNFPFFFTPSGPTMLRQIVLGAAGLLFMSASMIFSGLYSKSRIRVLLLYSLALASIGMGLLGSLFVTEFNGVLSWSTRLGQYVGGLYFLAVVLELRRIKSEQETPISASWSEALSTDRRQSAILFARMLNAFIYCRIVADKEGKPVDWVYLDANDSYLRMTGLKKENALGRRVTELFPDVLKDPADWIGKYGHVALNEEPIQFESYSQSLEKWLSVSSYSPKKGYFISILEDITERKKLEKELHHYTRNLEHLVEKRTKQLRDAERLATIGQTASMVGHDIRNPLQFISGAIYLAKDEVSSLPNGNKAKENLNELLEEIERGTKYINKIVSDLQDYTRPLHLNLEETNLPELIDSLTSAIDIPDNIEVTKTASSDLPKVMIDKACIQRTLTNLVLNAVQAMPEGGKLTVKVSKENDAICIDIEDTGIGISEENRAKMFTPLFTTKSKGQGFGLAVAKRMIDAHNGTISFESEVGKGTVFKVKIPIDERGR